VKHEFIGDDRPPPNWRRLTEAAWMLPRMWHAVAKPRPLGPEGGPPALVIPGWVASDRTTLSLRKGLAEAGWRVHGWDMGWNRGATADTVERLRERLEAVGDGGPVLLVGWSLGGVYAREVAREVPELVRAVVTLGSPFSGDPHMNNVWRMYEWVAGHKVDDPPVLHHPDKPPVPHLALWSKQDGIIAPRAARGLPDESDKAIEIGGSHMAFGVSRRTTRRVAQEIAKDRKSVV